MISGASGMIGTELAKDLRSKGVETLRLIRKKRTSGGEELFWDPSKGELDASGLNGVTAVINLAGKNIVSGRWNVRLKDEIRESRVNSTKLLCESLVQLPSLPGLVISASAIGFYGAQGDQVYTEEDKVAGTGFLARVCVEWEAETKPLVAEGIRVVNLRLGMVLSDRGGALSMMLPAFKLGVGGVLGDGTQYISWVTLADVVNIINFIIHNDSIYGPINVVTPNPVTNREFTKTLGRVLRRPTVCTIPRFLLRLLLRDMADETLLASCNVHPKKLLDFGYEFKHPCLENALNSLLRK